MEIETIVVGPLQTNCYLLINNDDCLIIDPGDDLLKIKEAIKTRNLLGILITHRHFDHIGALEPLMKLYKTRVYDYHNLEEQEYEIGPFKFEVIYTLGHSDDSVTYYFRDQEVMFVGDFIFLGSIGRTDLETGDRTKMKNSLDMIKTFKTDIKLYPGHGPSTSLLYEKENNYFLK